MPRRPNVVLLMAEELGQFFPAYAGNPDAETPCLDRLSRESVTFTRHFTVHGKCVPSRAALFSGRYCHNGGHRTLGIPLQDHEISLAAILREHGYHNIMALKNHTVADHLVERQFHERWLTGRHGEKPLNHTAYTAATTAHDRAAGGKYADNYLFGRLDVPETATCDYLAADRAADFIRRRRPDAPPFFLDLNFNYTHPPYEIMEPYYSRFMSKDLTLFPDRPGPEQPRFMHRMREIYGFDRLDRADRREMLACYYGMLAHLDRCVGMIHDALAETGELDHTVLIFTADHGDLAGHYGIPEKWDTVFSDLIMNIPLLIRLPDAAPHRTAALTENIDLLPTLLEYLDLPVPYGVQGRSLLPLLRGAAASHRDYVFAEGGHERELLTIPIAPCPTRLAIPGYLRKAAVRELEPDSLRKAKMIRTDRFKLVYRVCDRCELYDLREDPLELDNLYAVPAYRETVAALEKRLLEHLIESEENLPFDPQPIS